MPTDAMCWLASYPGSHHQNLPGSKLPMSATSIGGCASMRSRSAVTRSSNAVSTSSASSVRLTASATRRNTARQSEPVSGSVTAGAISPSATQVGSSDSQCHPISRSGCEDATASTDGGTVSDVATPVGSATHPEANVPEKTGS